MRALLRFEAVTLRRGGRLLFENLDLGVGPGEALHVTGANGSGKSSLIRLAAGLLRAEAGRVDRPSVALLDDAVTLDGELPLGKALRFWTPGVDQGVEAMGLAGLGQVPVRLLSSGQRKRASMARVAASGATLWLLDEPMNGLDADGVERLDTLIAHHRATGGAVVAASHHRLTGDWAQLELGR
ncbi:MAG: heme ABC exporter ATP-binding protein CcmA [Sphingomonas sp.]|nr:heme ABC exporter ATP-binding protein CcmA [Sphingomonas sp.]